MKICIVIPTYNEAKTIASIIRKIRQQELEVVVIDDGSQDNTFEIAKDKGAIVLHNQINEGKGASLVKGFNYALSKDFDAVITMDGDGQHLPEEIPYFIRLAKYSNSGVFIGNIGSAEGIKTKPDIIADLFTDINTVQNALPLLPGAGLIRLAESTLIPEKP